MGLEYHGEMNTSEVTMNRTVVPGNLTSLPSEDVHVRRAMSLLTVHVSAGAVLSNALVLTLFAVHRPLRTCANALVASLAVADLLFSGALLLTNLWHEEVREVPGMCVVVYILLPWSSTASPWSLLAITIDRYVYIRLPLLYGRQVGRRAVGGSIVGVWTLSLCFALFGLIQWPSGHRTRLICSGLVTRTLPYMCVYLSLVLVPCVCVAVLYCSILQVARRSNRLHQEMLLLVPAATDRSTPPEVRHANHAHAHDEDAPDVVRETCRGACAGPPSSPRKLRRIAKTTKMFFYLTVIFFVLWLPMHVSMSVLLLCDACLGHRMLMSTLRVSVALYTCTPLINPWIYTLRNRDFRAALRKLACCRRWRHQVDLSSSLASRNSVDIPLT